MKTFWILKGIKFAILFLLFIVVMGYVTMMLWNWLMPTLFGLSTIAFWQAMGILVLAKIIFGFGRGGWHGRSHWGHGYYSSRWNEKWKAKMEDRLKSMTPEEREKFRADWKRRCGGWYDWQEGKKEEAKPGETI